ncbi:MAG TPA: HEAT repeat domain-containing protein [Gemmatimonadales bacterium]|nr:HEAT repeat domain-containing protein [Gemmatimonadales bacterium]
MLEEESAALGRRLAGLAEASDLPARDRLILSGLEASGAQEREVAIAWAARCFEPPRLTGLVADEANAALRNGALEALRRQGPYALEHLHSRLDGDDPDLVMFSVQTLALIGSPASIPALLPLLRHTASNVVQVSAEALGGLRARAAVPGLIELLRGDLWLQLAAIEALGSIGDARAVGPLLSLYPDGPLAEPVAGALGRIAAPEAAPALVAVLGQDRWRPLWPATLVATAASISTASDPASVVGPLNPLLDQGELADFFLAALGGQSRDAGDPGAAAGTIRDDRRQARGGGTQQRAAALLALASAVRRQVRAVMALGAETDWADWLAPQADRFAKGLGVLAGPLLTDADPLVRAGALRVLPAGVLSTSKVEACLQDPQQEVRTAACLALGRLQDPTAVPALLDRLRTGSPAERTAAAAALSAVPGAEVQDALASCLAPETPREVMLAALSALERAGGPSIESRLLELARSPAVEVRRGALRALAPLPGGKGEVALLRALADRDSGVQTLALDLLVKRGGEHVLRTFLMMLQANDSLRYHVIRALGRLGAPEAAPALQTLYPGCQLHERLEILTALGRLGAPGRQQFLRQQLHDSEIDIRRAAAWAVAESARADDLPLLEEMARDADWALRGEAARGLGRSGADAARPLLLDLARDLERVVAGVAVRALEAASPGRSPG